MIGTKLYKGKKSDMAKYTNTAVWCNANNAHIVDQGEYYEVVENVVHEPTKAELIAQLDAQYDVDKKDLQNYFITFLMNGDTESANSIKEEMLALNEQYDTDRAELEGE